MAKDKKKGIHKFVDEHVTELVISSALIGGIVAGFIIGKDIGWTNGYSKGLVEFRDAHNNVCKELIDKAGSNAAFAALNLVRSDEVVYDILLKNPDMVLKKAEKAFYDLDEIKELVELYK